MKNLPPTPLDEALNLAAQGYKVYPIRAAGGASLTDHPPTSDPDEIKALWERWPSAIVGRANGATIDEVATISASSITYARLDTRI